MPTQKPPAGPGRPTGREPGPRAAGPPAIRSPRRWRRPPGRRPRARRSGRPGAGCTRGRRPAGASTRRAPFGQRASGEDAVGVADEVPLLGADPEGAVASLRQVEDPVASQRRHPLAVEHLEAGAVEARRAPRRSASQRKPSRVWRIWAIPAAGRPSAAVNTSCTKPGLPGRRSSVLARTAPDREAEGCHPEERDGARSFGHVDERIRGPARIIVPGTPAESAGVGRQVTGCAFRPSAVAWPFRAARPR